MNIQQQMLFLYILRDMVYLQTMVYLCVPNSSLQAQVLTIPSSATQQ